MGDLGMEVDQTTLVLYTNGVYRAFKGFGPLRGNVSKWFYEETLTAEQRRYLAMWLEVTDFIHRPRGVRPSLYSEMVLYEAGRTNSIFVRMEDPELGHIDFFLQQLVWRSEGHPKAKNGARISANIDRPLGIPHERPVSLLKAFVSGPSIRVDLLSEALRFLSKFLLPEQWAGFVARSFESAPEPKRRALLDAATSAAYSLQTRVSEEHRKALSAVVAGWHEAVEK
jgi:hypothetical protein